MPSIANQDFKIYGLLDAKNVIGIPGNYCGEYFAALRRSATTGIKSALNMADGFAFVSSGDGIVRQVANGVYYDYEVEDWKLITPKHSNPTYYDAIWAIQQAIYGYDETPVGEGMEFAVSVDGGLLESGVIGVEFINEDGYLIKCTSADGKLASLYLGDKVEDLENYAVVRLESLLPLVGELPLETTEIW